MTYNVTLLFNTTDYGEYIRILDSDSGGLLGLTLLGVCALVFVLVFFKRGVGVAITASGFISTLVAILLFVLGALQPYVIIYPVLMFAGGLIGTKLQGGD